MRKNKTLQIRVDESLQIALFRAAQGQDRGLSNLCRVLLRDGLARLEIQSIPVERQGSKFKAKDNQT